MDFERSSQKYFVIMKVGRLHLILFTIYNDDPGHTGYG